VANVILLLEFGLSYCIYKAVHLTSNSRRKQTVGCVRTSQIIANYFQPLSRALGLQGSVMQYRKKLVILLFVLFSVNSSAGDKKIKIGVTWDYTASGFFSPEVDELIVNKVIANSPAEKAGLKVGDKVLSLEGCNIPGCPASKVKGYLKSDSGTELHLVIENNKGVVENLMITVG
jgi:membrane-associated protease RseP (regulator of RpoE activity)